MQRVCESVVLSVRSQNTQHQPATILEISKSEFTVQSGLDLAPGVEIQTTLNSVAIFGIVKDCRAIAEDCFTAGVQITDVVPAV